MKSWLPLNAGSSQDFSWEIPESELASLNLANSWDKTPENFGNQEHFWAFSLHFTILSHFVAQFSISKC